MQGDAAVQPDITMSKHEIALIVIGAIALASHLVVWPRRASPRNPDRHRII
jgi:hypothetical protein